MKFVLLITLVSAFFGVEENAFAGTTNCQLMEIGQATKVSLKFVNGSAFIPSSNEMFPCVQEPVNFETIMTIEDREVAVTRVCGPVSVLTGGWNTQSDVFYAQLDGSYFKCSQK
ncbi:MAG: hypothetical protein AB7O96_13895 [Pseudobdellovibrionaceae bacterium]